MAYDHLTQYLFERKAKPFTNYPDLVAALEATTDYKVRRKIFDENQSFIQSSNLTLTEVQKLFEDLNTPQKHRMLMEILPWERLTATPNELAKIARILEPLGTRAEDSFLHGIVQRFLISNPKYFQTQAVGIKKQAEFKILLELSATIDRIDEMRLNEEASETDKIIQGIVTSAEICINVLPLFSNNPILQERIIKAFLMNAKDLSTEEISKIGKIYTGGNQERAFKFAEMIVTNETIKTADDLLNVLRPFSEEEQESIINKFLIDGSDQLQHELSAIREIGLIMGLKGSLYEGYGLAPSNQMTKLRFNNLSLDDSEPLAFEPMAHYRKASNFSDPIKEHGDLKGIHTMWEQHTFSFHLIKDGDQTHLIYVNRGQQHELAADDDQTVSVFTFANQNTTNSITSKLIAALRTEKRDKISEFIHASLMPYHNKELSDELIKSNQKVGNCSVANANMAWHLALASREMKKDVHCSFSQAYEKTKVEYKTMRMEDRAQAFCELMTNPTLKTFQKDAVEQVMRKMHAKDLKTPGRETIRFLLNRLHEKDPHAVKNLLQDLCEFKYDLDTTVKLRWIKTCVNKLKEEGLYKAEENGLVEKNIKTLEALLKTNFLDSLKPDELKQHLINNPSDINFLSENKRRVDFVISLDKSILHHLSVENIQYILKKEPLATRPRFINILAADQISALIQNGDKECLKSASNKVLQELLQKKEISLNDLSEVQKRNIELVKAAYQGDKENIELARRAYQIDRRCIHLFSDSIVQKLLQAKEIAFAELSVKQKENIEHLEFGAIDQEAFCKQLSDDPDFSIIYQFNQSGKESFLPMLNRSTCIAMSTDFAQAVTEGQFADWHEKIAAKDIHMLRRLQAGQQNNKWSLLKQSSKSPDSVTSTESPLISLKSGKSINLAERKAVSEKIAASFQGFKSDQSCMFSPCVFLSAERMQRKDSLVQIGHGMMFTMATTKEGKLDPDHLLFLDPNAGIIKIKNNAGAIEKLMTCIDEKLFSEFSVGSFQVTPVSKVWLEKPTEQRSYALSQVALIEGYLNAQISRLEPQKGGDLLWGFLWKGSDEKLNGLIECKKELSEYLKGYLTDPNAKESDLIEFQQKLLKKIDTIASEKRYLFGFSESTSKTQLESLKQRLSEMKIPEASSSQIEEDERLHEVRKNGV